MNLHEESETLGKQHAQQHKQYGKQYNPTPPEYMTPHERTSYITGYKNEMENTP